MVVLRRSEVSPFGMLYSDAQQFSFRREVYEVYLASSNHLNLVQLRRFYGENEAYQAAFALAQQMEVSLVRYNPGRRLRREITEAHLTKDYL
jgi:hypothetical protein